MVSADGYQLPNKSVQLHGDLRGNALDTLPALSWDGIFQHVPVTLKSFSTLASMRFMWNKELMPNIDIWTVELLGQQGVKVLPICRALSPDWGRRAYAATGLSACPLYLRNQFLCKSCAFGLAVIKNNVDWNRGVSFYTLNTFGFHSGEISQNLLFVGCSDASWIRRLILVFLVAQKLYWNTNELLTTVN